MREVVHKVLVFVITFLGYASLHSMREGWSFSKSELQDDLGVGKNLLGWVDAIFLLFYTLGMGILGSFIHRVSLKKYITIGLICSSIFYMLFAFIYALTKWFSPVVMVICMCINGFFQAAGWPGIMGIMGNWFKDKKKGALLAVWSLNGNAGNLIGLNLCNVLSNHGISWVWNFFLTGLFALLVALLTFTFLKEKPDEPQSVLTEEEGAENEQSMLSTQQREKPQEAPSTNFKYGIFSVLCLPRVPLYLIGYACVKGAVYGLLFWLPTFFDHKGGSVKDQKGYIASMIDVGTLIGCVTIGHLSDLFKKRAVFLTPLLLICAAVMFVVSFALRSVSWEYYIAMLLIGFSIGAPYYLIGTLIAIDTGNHIKQKGSVAKVSSLIEGTGAFFTALEMIVIPYIPFDDIFYLFSSQALLAGLVLMPLFLEEVREICNGGKPNQEMILNEDE